MKRKGGGEKLNTMRCMMRTRGRGSYSLTFWGLDTHVGSVFRWSSGHFQELHYVLGGILTLRLHLEPRKIESLKIVNMRAEIVWGGRETVGRLRNAKIKSSGTRNRENRGKGDGGNDVHASPWAQTQTPHTIQGINLAAVNGGVWVWYVLKVR